MRGGRRRLGQHSELTRGSHLMIRRSHLLSPLMPTDDLRRAKSSHQRPQAKFRNNRDILGQSLHQLIGRSPFTGFITFSLVADSRSPVPPYRADPFSFPSVSQVRFAWGRQSQRKNADINRKTTWDIQTSCSPMPCTNPFAHSSPSCQRKTSGTD